MERTPVRTTAELEDDLSRPSAALVEDMARLDGDLLVLGASGKLGPSLVRLAVRAIEAAGTGARVVAVSRYSHPGAKAAMAATGAEAVTADIADDEQLSGLPDAPNVVMLVGAKFGTAGGEAATWTTNAYLPGRVAARYAGARIAALSTGNVYPFVPVGEGGAAEETPPAPVGEYAMSCLGRERVLEHASLRDKTPIVLLRLNYAVEMRYGVLVDVASAVVAKEPVDVTTGFANVVWQGYANEVTLRSLLHAASPAMVLNLTGPETVSIRRLALRLGELMDVPVEIVGQEAPTALLSDATRCHGLFGYPGVTLSRLIEETAAWILAGGELLGKPTKFSRRDGRF